MVYTDLDAMADIQFEEEQDLARPTFVQSTPASKSTFVRLLLRTGIVTSERTAQYVLIFLSVIALLATIAIFVDRDSPRGSSMMSNEPPQFKAERQAAHP